MFSVNDHNANLSNAEVKIIDTFFESLNLGEKESEWTVEDEIPLGQLTSTADTSNRWVYKAKEPFPPCERNTYYNVVSIVYPIKEEHLNLIKAHISQVPGVPQNGNYRETQNDSGSDVRLIV